MTDVASPTIEGLLQGPADEVGASVPGLEVHRIAGCQFSLISDAEVFKPTLTTTLLTQRVLNEGVGEMNVLDLGCGLGPIAIALALSGASHVWAVDAMARACELARVNARINGLIDRLTVLEGDLFDPLGDRKFDVVVDDVSGVASQVARLSRWFPEQVPLGGEDGSVLTVRMLRAVRNHLVPGGRLYFPVLSLSNREGILAVAADVFAGQLQRVDVKQVPFSPELKEHLPTLLDLRERGIIRFEQIRSRCFWTLEIYRGTNFG